MATEEYRTEIASLVGVPNYKKNSLTGAGGQGIVPGQQTKAMYDPSMINNLSLTASNIDRLREEYIIRAQQQVQPAAYQDPWTSPKASVQPLKVATNSDMILDFRRIENGFIVTKRNAKSGMAANETFCADIDAVGEYVKSQYIAALLQGEKK